MITTKIVGIGEKLQPGCDAIGGDKRLLKVGLKYEITGLGEDDGPVLIAACPDLPTAKRVKIALTLLDRAQEISEIDTDEIIFDDGTVLVIDEWEVEQCQEEAEDYKDHKRGLYGDDNS